ncbi:MAG: ankyrin repeat domain-containing protein [Wolbachia endosymbiont of Fragariocoptes setiger]|nr:ankyrin repeat domain-containing protein [Wolbachia endosymbiont of Fragariocoptes setiger]
MFNHQTSKTLESEYTSFYQTIRSGDVKLLETLISKCTIKHSQEKLDELLSQAYEELKLKNVSISNEMEVFVESKIIGLRFFSDNSIKDQRNSIKERVKLFVEAVELLNSEYLKREVDEKFLFVAKFIAQNVYILKRQLKSTYSALPWEEIEFCLVSFISSYTTQQENNLFCQSKDKILCYLQNFINKLQKEIENLNLDKPNDIPKLKREKVVKNIIRNSPEFEDLYSDYKQIRDIHSLERISNYVQLALSANPKEREGQLIIIRVLQAIGEYLKNTLESPKLSDTTSDLLLLSLPKGTREIVIDLRNSLSHSYSLSRRMEIEENANVNFFSGVQSDTKKIGNVVTNILYKNKIKIIKQLVQKIIDSESFYEIKEVVEAFNNAELMKTVSENFQMNEHEELEKVIAELSTKINDKTMYEKQLFDQIHKIIDSEKDKLKGVRDDYFMGFASLKSLSMDFHGNENDKNFIRQIKFHANQTLKNMSTKVEQHKLKDIAQLSMKILDSVSTRKKSDEIERIIHEIFYIAEFKVNDLKWIEELREKLNERTLLIYEDRQKKKTYANTKYNSHLEGKVSELKSILTKNKINDEITPILSFCNSNKKLQVVIEMLVLDIVSILDSSLENNLLFLDDNTPLLTGKCLRNHLAHDNALFNILFNPLTAIISNAQKLTKESIVSNKRKLGKCVIDDPERLRSKYNQGLTTIVNQQRMFVALEEGNIEELENCLRNGADINSRSINSWSALHFAAKGGNSTIIKLVLDKGLNYRMKDVDGQSLIHIASSYGRKDTVEFLIKEMDLNINDEDNKRRTPLHVAAANGHNDTVKILLQNGGNTTNYDIAGLSPLHHAVRNDHLHVVKTLLKRDTNVDINQSMGGFTALHAAAEFDYLELTNFLLNKGANPNAQNDRKCSPLHLASLNGHTEIVNALISKGADVNVVVINGCTPLHYAVENGHEEIANV